MSAMKSFSSKIRSRTHASSTSSLVRAAAKPPPPLFPPLKPPLPRVPPLIPPLPRPRNAPLPLGGAIVLKLKLVRCVVANLVQTSELMQAHVLSPPENNIGWPVPSEPHLPRFRRQYQRPHHQNDHDDEQPDHPPSPHAHHTPLPPPCLSKTRSSTWRARLALPPSAPSPRLPR